MLFVLSVIAGLFNMIAAMYSQGADQQARSEHVHVHQSVSVCVCVLPSRFRTRLRCTLDSFQSRKLLQGETCGSHQ